MKRKVIDVSTFSSDSQKIEVLSVEQSNVDQLMAILQLCPVDGTVTIHVHEIEVQAPSFGGFTPKENV